MTLPDERYRAVMWAERFLRDLSNNKTKYPRVSKKIRQEAYSILRHFPREYDMKWAAEKSPEVFQEKMEPLYRMVLKHEQDKQNDN
jgi:hypothetical protein